MNRIPIVALFLLFSLFANSDETLRDVVAEHHKIIRSDNDFFEYGLKVSKLIWVEWEVVDKCSTEDSFEVSDFLYEISPVGDLVKTWHFPKTKISVCVENYLLNKQFPKPPGRYVGLENLQSGE